MLKCLKIGQLIYDVLFNAIDNVDRFYVLIDRFDIIACLLINPTDIYSIILEFLVIAMELMDFVVIKYSMHAHSYTYN